MYKSNCDKEKILKNIEIVLASPAIPENIGLVARVLKNTSFSNLSLVNPKLTSKSNEVAKRARDLIKKAKIYDSLTEAVKSSTFVFGSSRRKREYKVSFNFNEIKHLIICLASNKRVSIVFGNETFGLSRSEAKDCDSIFCTPANPSFSSYNLANAVGIVCYEIFNLLDNAHNFCSLNLAKREEYETLFAYMERYLESRTKKNRVEPTLQSLKRIFLRTHLTKNEVALLKSLFLKA